MFNTNPENYQKKIIHILDDQKIKPRRHGYRKATGYFRLNTYHEKI